MEKINPFDFSSIEYSAFPFIREGVLFRDKQGKTVKRDFGVWLVPFDPYQDSEARAYAEDQVVRFLGVKDAAGKLLREPEEESPFSEDMTEEMLRKVAYLDFSIGLAQEWLKAKRREGASLRELPTYNDIELARFIEIAPDLFDDLFSALWIANTTARKLEEEKDDYPFVEGAEKPSPPALSSTGNTQA